MLKIGIDYNADLYLYDTHKLQLKNYTNKLVIFIVLKDFARLLVYILYIYELT